MIKSKNGEVVLDGNSEDLLLEATGIVINVIQALVEQECLESKDVPKVINIITQQIEAFTKDLVPNKK